MKRTLSAILSLVLLGMATPAFADPYAKTFADPSGGKDVTLAALLGRAKKTMPDVSAVKVPLYPEAKAISIEDPMGDTLPAVKLLSADAPEKVTAFFKTKLDGWNSSSRFGMTGFSADEVSLMGPAKPTVVIMAFDPASFDPKFFKEMKTQILVYYSAKTK